MDIWSQLTNSLCRARLLYLSGIRCFNGWVRSRPLPQSILEVFDMSLGLGEGNVTSLSMILIWNFEVWYI